MAYPQSAIVITEDPFGNTPKRPYLIISNDHVPFYGQEYIAVVITTTARTEAIELTTNRFETGRLPRTSYVSPWSVLDTQRLDDSQSNPQKRLTRRSITCTQEMEAYLRTD